MKDYASKNTQVGEKQYCCALEKMWLYVCVHYSTEKVNQGRKKEYRRSKEERSICLTDNSVKHCSSHLSEGLGRHE
jgi:hypothetical protein